MKIFVTGGAGFIGSALINKMTKNHSVKIYDNLSFGNKKFLNISDNDFILGDILDKENLLEALISFQPDIVVHLAAIHFIPYCNLHPFESANINIKGTMNVVDSIKSVPSVKKLFFASTAAVYPIHDYPISEDLSPSPLDIYGLSKLAGEEICKAFYLETSIPTIVCRFFNAFGPNETNDHLIPAIQNQLLEGNLSIKLGNTSPKRDFIHTYDMADAVLNLLMQFNAGIETFNLGSGLEYSVDEVIETFQNILNKKIIVEIDQSKVRKSDRPHLVANIEKISNFLQWQPKINLEMGLRTLLNENS
jgi:UDP-glucose 4-epimerase